MSEPQPVLTLAYATPAATVAEPRRSLLAAATFCGAAPLCVGFLSLAGFLLSKSDNSLSEANPFVALGLLTILFGLLLFVIGISCLIAYFWQVARLPPERCAPHRPLMRRRLLLLISNFPAAVFCIVVAIYAL